MKSVGHILTGNVFNSALSFVISIIVLRHYDFEAIGMLYPLVGIMMMANQWLDLGMTTAFIKISSGFYHSDKERALSIFSTVLKTKLVLGLFVMIICLVMREHISILLFEGKNLHPHVLIIILTSFFSNMGTFFLAILQIEGKFKHIMYIKILPVTVKFFSILLLFQFDNREFWPLYAAFLFVPMGTFLGALPFCSVMKWMRLPFDREILIAIAVPAKWIFLSLVATVGIGQTDIFMVRSMAGSRELGLLMGGQKLSSVFPIFVGSLVTVLLPKVTSMVTIKELNFFFRRSLILIPFSLVGFLILYLLSDFLIPTLLGQRYVESIPVFKMYLLAFSVGLVITPVSLIVYRLNKEHWLSIMNWIQLIANIGGNYLLIPKYGAIGATLSTAFLRVIALVIIGRILWTSGVVNFKEDNHDSV